MCYFQIQQQDNFLNSNVSQCVCVCVLNLNITDLHVSTGLSNQTMMHEIIFSFDVWKKMWMNDEIEALWENSFDRLRPLLGGETLGLLKQLRIRIK